LSFLTPLYALGLLAIAGPILFHLIQRKPKGEVPFSSLMFLTPTPPRLTRRSRLDNLLLLLLRAAVLGLLALAFARPFLRQTAQLDSGNADRQRLALVIDTSASMRRGTLWPRARAQAEEVIAACRPTDQLALFAFDGSTRTLLGFDESGSLDPSRRQAVARARLQALQPTWEATHLGQALIDVVGAIEDVTDANEKAERMPRRIVLISDLQQGSRIDTLGGFDWPSDVDLELKTVTEPGSNASLHPLASTTEEEESQEGSNPNTQPSEPGRRVGVSNESGSTREAFQVVHLNDKGAETGKPIDVYVPPGESRVVRIPDEVGQGKGGTLRLKGDAFGFDNTLYSTREHREESKVLYVGEDDGKDPNGLLYYLNRVFQDTSRRTVRVLHAQGGADLPLEAPRLLPLVVVSTELPARNAQKLKTYVEQGGTVLGVVTASGKWEALASIAGDSPWNVEEGTVPRDLMLGEIAFDHPLFAPLASAQYNDFTKIHFWKYRRIDADQQIKEGRVIARFENGDPALVEKRVKQGRLLVLATGWAPADSQLARSSKFVPLMAALLEGAEPRVEGPSQLLVREPIRLPATDEGKGRGKAASDLTVLTPGGGSVRTAPGKPVFEETDEPGLYSVRTPEGERSYAVNLDPLESKTSPLNVETLEQFGCRLSSPTSRELDRELQRQLRNAELEGRQKFWRWVILTSIGILIVETWLAGRQTNAISRPERAEALTT